MNEKKEIEALVRAALESGEPMRIERLSALERAATAMWAERWRTGVWRRRLLIAASVMVVCALGAWRLSLDRCQAQECRAVAMLELLEELDGGYVSDEAASFADRLVAWQDAPYEEVMR